MAIHWVRVIESGHQSTARLFELVLSLRVCKRTRRWPSLQNINSFLARGTDDGDLGTDIEWEPTVISQVEYETALTVVMKDEHYEIEVEPLTWEEWLAKSGPPQ